MSVGKRISTGNYDISTSKYSGNPGGNITMETHTLYIDGNVVITGTSTNVQAFDTTNQIFHINANLFAPSSPLPGYSGFENRRGIQANVGLYWDEDGSNAGEWIANNSVGNIGPILTTYNLKVEKGNTNPTGSATYVVITGNDAGVGGTGLFVNAGASSTEVVSVQTARKFAIIFG